MPTKKQKEWVSKEQNTAFLRSAMEAYHLPPIDYSDPMEVAIRIEWYFNHCAEEGIRPVVSGIANAIGVPRSRLIEWANGVGGTPDHRLAARRALALCEELMESYMTANSIHPVNGMFLMTNNFAGWQNHAEKNPQEYRAEIGTTEDVLRKRYLTVSPAEQPQKKAEGD